MSKIYFQQYQKLIDWNNLAFKQLHATINTLKGAKNKLLMKKNKLLMKKNKLKNKKTFKFLKIYLSMLNSIQMNIT